MKILEYFEKDIATLHSCLLCEISVRILVGSDYNINIILCPLRQIRLSFFNTLIACLPNESKEFLNKNMIFISTPSYFEVTII
jgi:hypothetical protein